MSRIGKRPVKIPQNVKVAIDNGMVVVEGAKGKLSQSFDQGISISVKDGVVTVERSSNDKKYRAMHGLYRALINNMINGVTKGFRKELAIEGVGYKAQMKGKVLVLDMGFSHQIEFIPPAGVTISVPVQTTIIIEGIDRQVVGQVAANIRAFKKPEPYKGKGIRYVGEYVRRKQGKKVG